MSDPRWWMVPVPPSTIIGRHHDITAIIKDYQCVQLANLLILSQTSLSENFSLSSRFFERNFLSAPSPVARVWRSTPASRLTSLAWKMRGTGGGGGGGLGSPRGHGKPQRRRPILNNHLFLYTATNIRHYPKISKYFHQCNIRKKIKRIIADYVLKDSASIIKTCN